MNDIEGKYFLLNGVIKAVEEFNSDLVLKNRTIYEVIRVMNGKPLFYKEHIDRLKSSAGLAGINMPVSDEELKSQTIEFLKINQANSGNFKIIVKEASGLGIFMIKHRYPDKIQYEEGVDTILYHGERKTPNIKLIDTMFRANVNESIRAKNVYEAILVDRKGYITEGSRSNIFMVIGNMVITSPAAEVLQGITRSKIIEISKELGFTVIEDKIKYEELEAMDGLFISGTSPEVLPVKRVDDIDFDSRNNSVIKKIMEKYRKLTLEDIKSFTL
ncbi:MAG: aminotransferase class IV [Clostridiaceae bacterium]